MSALDAWQRRILSGQAGAQHDAAASPSSACAARVCDVRGLDRSDRGRRSAAGAAAAAGDRAQRRDHRMGLGRPEGVSARRGLDRSPQSDAATPNGLIYGSLELSADYLPVLDPVAQHRQPRAADGARSGDAADVRRDDAALARTGARKPIWTSTNNVHNPMFDDEGPRLDHVHRPPVAPNPDFCKAGLGSSVGEALSGQQRGRHLAVYDPKTRAAHAHQHLLQHAPPDVRRGREQHAVDERRRSGRRLAEHEDVRRDARRGEVAGLDGARHGHERQRQARRVRRAEPAGRSREGQAVRRRRSMPSRPRPTDRCGDRCSGCRARSCGWCPGSNPPETALAEVYEPPFDESEATSRASTPRGDGRRSQRRRLGGARERASGELRSPQVQGSAERPDGDRASIARKGGPCIRSRCRSSRASPIPAAPARSYYTWVDQFDTLGPRREHADQHRQRRRSAARAEGRQVGRRCASRTRSATTRSGWTAASTIPTADGRAAASGRPSARARRSTWKAARGRRAR